LGVEGVDGDHHVALINVTVPRGAESSCGT
jgi:hypothetical protein